MCVGIGFSDQTLILNHGYPISSNNSHPSINYLGPQIITPAEGSIIASSNNRPPHPSRHPFFLLHPPCQVEVESDPAKLISDK